MIDNVPIYASTLSHTELRIVIKSIRLREIIDRKKNYLIVKKIWDMLFASLFILFILSWLTPIIGLLIKIDSKGPIFFFQKRVGLGGKGFICIKFRTMFVNKYADFIQAEAQDERITRVGFFLRKLNIDEFPQFINVLFGTMSIVGPRPHMYVDCKNFSSQVPEYKFRNFVKPGITGLAQVKGYHGLTPNKESILLRYRWDRYYINNISFLFDIKILINTTFQRIIILFNLFRNRAIPRIEPVI